MSEEKNAPAGEGAASPEGTSTPETQAATPPTSEATPAVKADSAPAESDSASAPDSAKAEEGAPTNGAVKAELASSAPELPGAMDLSFAEMFEAAEKQSAEKRKKQQKQIGGKIAPGQVIFAKIVSIAGDSVFLDIGAKAEGVIAKAELVDEEGNFTLKEGDKVEARVRKYDAGVVMLSKVLPHQSLKNREELREAFRSGMAVEGKVSDKNKGGFDVQIAGMRAFCPNSQIDLRPGNADNYIGRKYGFKITEFKQDGRNIVVSRRQILAEENKKKAEALLGTIEVGSIVLGRITSIKDYGAFVDIGGLEGLVHLSELTHSHIVKPRDILQVGQDIQAKILKIEDGKGDQKKISLSMKALEADPWAAARETIKEGQKVKGRIARIQQFGAFVEILPGVDGLIHISNMAQGRRIADPKEIVKEGEEVEATVVSTDWSKRRIGLSLVKTPQELANEVKKQEVVEGTVDRIEGFGLFVKLPTGARGLVPSAETGTDRGTDLKKHFSAGQKVRVLVMEVDRKTGKIRLSIRRAKEAEERAEYVGYLSNSSESSGGMGTLGDLLRGKLQATKD